MLLVGHLGERGDDVVGGDERRGAVVTLGDRAKPAQRGCHGQGRQGRLRDVLDKEAKVEGELRREIQLNIKRLMEIGTYRGLRHRRGLPVRGQRRAVAVHLQLDRMDHVQRDVHARRVAFGNRDRR